MCNDIKFWHTNRRNINVILGLANNIEITLYKCVFQSDSLLAKPSLITFRVEIIIKGKHFKNFNSHKIQNAQLKFNNINDWFTTKTFNCNFWKKDGSPRKQPISVQPKRKFKSNINDNFVLHLIAIHSMRSIQNSSEYRIVKDSYFDMKFKKRISFDDLIDYIKKLNKFLSFGLQTPTYSTSIKANKKVNRFEFEIYIKNKVSNDVIKNSIQRREMLFCFEDIEKEFSGLLQNWFNSYESLSNLYTLYFSVLNENLYLELEFITMIQILESFHRNFFPKSKPKIPKPEFRKRKKIIIKNLPEECDKSIYKEWLDVNLNNQPSLQERIDYLFERFNKILIDFNDKEIFKKVVVNTRNLISHALNVDEKNVESFPVATDPYHLYNLHLKTKIFVDICFLENLGLTNSDISNYLNKYWKYENILNGKDYFSDYGIITNTE